MTTWKDVEARNRGIDAGVPKHGAAHVDRGEGSGSRSISAWRPA